jgi:hypothetical protein
LAGLWELFFFIGLKGAFLDREFHVKEHIDTFCWNRLGKNFSNNPEVSSYLLGHILLKGYDAGNPLNSKNLMR